jgi:hypothetical protein
MRTMVRGKVTLLFMTLGLLLALPAIALADIVHDQVNNVDTNVKESINLVEGNTTTVKYWIERVNPSGGADGDGDGGCNIDNGEQLYIKLASDAQAVANAVKDQANVKELTVGGVKGLYVGPFTACDDPATLTDPITGFPIREGVQSADIKGLSVGSANFSVTVPASGTTGTDANNATVQLNTTGAGTYDVTTDGTFAVNVAAANTAPTVPGVPSGSTPNQGVFTLNWAASIDDGKPAGSSVTYTLQHKDSDDANFSNVATSISGNSYSFTAASPEAEGTWTYRVQASDGSLSSAFSAASSEIKVDQSRPNAPLANEGTPDYTASNGDKWFKNSATVSFTATGDQTLADGSDGSGVASVSPAQSRLTTGALNYSGTATDFVGLVSLATTGTVHVDATNPVVGITCPSTSAILGSTTASAGWTASDVGSGLATANSGSVALITNAIAANLTATAPTATDNVGLQSALATCNYSVAAGFHGFLQPIDGNTINTGKVGRTYPIKWQLKDSSGALISDALALSLVSQMSVQQRANACDPSLPQDQLETEVSTTSSNTVRYDEASDQFIFNYKAPSTKGCYNLEILKADGVNMQKIFFNFTR